MEGESTTAVSAWPVENTFSIEDLITMNRGCAEVLSCWKSSGERPRKTDLP